MNDSIGELILRGLADDRMSFVFPSEIAARDRIERALDASGRRALSSARFLSWDAFKARVFPGPDSGRPASLAIRSVFARSLMQENAEAPFLSVLVPKEKAGVSLRFAKLIAKALPALGSLPAANGGQLADWTCIRDRYATFLSERGLYDPGWNSRVPCAVPGSFMLFYPDLTTDWADYEEGVRSMPDVELLLSDTLSAETSSGAAFGTLVDEVRAVILKILSALEEGVDPASIVISVAAPEKVLPVLEREAGVAGLPLDIREALPLSESTGGSLLADILDFSRSGRSFDSVRRLLLNRSRPWKDTLACRALVDLGIRKHVLCPLPGQDVWESSMTASNDTERRLYRGLKMAADKIASARGFGQLRLSFDAFRRAFMDESGWTKIQNDELARCILELEELDEAARAADLTQITGAAEAFMEQLEEQRYLPVSDHHGIAVYRFPVAACCLPELHFVLNLSEDAATLSSRPLSFLREDERESLGAKDRDLSTGIIKLLACSGKTVFLTWAEEGPDGVRAHHQALRAETPDSIGMEFAPTDWLPNRDALGERSLDHVFSSQKKSAQAALATVFPGPGPYYCQGQPGKPGYLNPSLRDQVLARQSKNETLQLSDTLIEELCSCSFKRLFSRFLNVRAVDTGLSFVDALMTGSLYHSALAAIFRPLAQNELCVLAPGSEAGESESSRPRPDELASALDAGIAEQERQYGLHAGILLKAVRPALLRDLSRALDALLPLLDGWIPVLVEEQDTRASLPSAGMELVGRMDLVCAKPGQGGGSVRPHGNEKPSALIIDFKKNKVPTLAELSPDELGLLTRLQMPAYAALVSALSYKPVGAYYLSVENATTRKRCAFGDDPKAAQTLDALPRLQAALEQACKKAADILSRGEIFVPSPEDQESHCINCEYRSICRVRYIVR